MTRILVVDDEPQILRALRINLRARRYDVAIAGELSATHKGGTNYNVNGALNLPIVEGKLAARVVGWYVDDSGFIDQTRIPAGFLKNVNNDRTSGGRASLRFTPTDERVMITASALGDRVELRVIDRGPGIPPTDRDRVFLPFQRLDDRDNTWVSVSGWPWPAGCPRPWTAGWCRTRPRAAASR